MNLIIFCYSLIHVGSNSPLTSEVEHVDYLIEMEGKLLKQGLINYDHYLNRVKLSVVSKAYIYRKKKKKEENLET
jgi:hypothetical protein